MKKIFLLSAMAMLFAGQAVAQSSQDVNYVEDKAQGIMLNRMKDNWFITAEGGGNRMFSGFNNKRAFFDGIGPAFGLYIGKWWTPIIGTRIGVNMLLTKSLSRNAIYGNEQETVNGYYKERFNEIGPVADVIINLTNWIGGYKPRVWNISVYAGGGGYWSLTHNFNYNAATDTYEGAGWHNGHDRVLTIHGGIMNTFKVSKHFDLGLDVRYSFYDGHDGTYKYNPNAHPVNRTAGNLQAYVNLTYKFNKTDWNGPMVPVCPPAEDCSQYIAALDDANAKIAELETQLRACLDRPAPQPVAAPESNDHLATIYFPKNVDAITAEDGRVLQAIAEVMNAHPNQRYTITGWADNYTGNDAINTRLRHGRANNVTKALVKFGVNPDQLNTTINAGNLCDLGEKCVSLDRAVTIDEQ